nr:hypothetical protein [Tanacetum cinerariifolium]
IHHGEADLPPPPPVIDNTRQPRMSDMTSCLNELSYIPLNNEQNKPTQGDIGETSNDPTQAKRNEFEELYASANEGLYPGCDYKVQKKVLRYFLIIPRLQRLYKSSHTAKEMNWHATGKCVEPGKMQHPVDGLAADGFNPFGNLSQSYNMWPVILTTYNLPPWLCMKESYFMLTLLIPGSKSPGKDIGVYLRPLIDDLKVLWAKPGVETIDIATVLKFNMRAMVLWTINDSPARSSLSGWSGQGYRACPTCNEDTSSVRVLGKTAYVGHKRFLKKSHKWRRSLEFNGETKNGDPPREFSRDAIMTQLVRLPTRVKGKPPRVKLPDGFGSNLKYKVTDNDTNITGLKSHDCHTMMQRLLPYGLQQYLAPDVAKPLIELCLIFKQICSQTLMVDDMLKAHSKRLFWRPIRPRWMYPFERYMKMLKNYVRNKAKTEDSIAEGYVAEEALTFSSHYFWDVTTKFNHPYRNVDCLPPTCQLQVFKSLCKSIGLWSVIRIDHQELKKVIWYVLHNSPEIDTYRSKFKIEFPNKDMKEEIPGWFGKQDDPDVIHVNNSSDLALSTSLNDLEIAALYIDGQSIDVDAPLDIIDGVDEDDDIIDEEDHIPRDLADSDNEDLVNLDIDDDMSADVARGHGGDDGGDDRPPPYQGTRKPNLGGRRVGRLHTRQESRNLGLKAITDKSGPVPIRFEVDDRETLMPLGDHAAH